MSKFCGQCGSENMDDAISCVNCGSSFDAPSNQTTQDNSEPKANKSKMMVLIGACVAAVVVIAVVLVLVLGGGATKAVEDFCSLTSDGDFDAIEELAPEDIIRDLEKKYNVDLEDVIEYVENEYKDMLDRTEEVYGEDISFDYEVIDESDLYKSDFKDLKNNLKENYDISKSDVTDAKACCVKVTTESEDDGSVYYDTYYAAKIDGDWYVVDYSGEFVVESVFMEAAEESGADYSDDYSDDYDFDFDFDY